MKSVRFREPAANSGTLSPADVAIARSVLYASLFDYPLTLAQLRQTLTQSAQTPTEIRAAYDASKPLQTVIEFRDGFFFPRGRGDLIAERRRREARSREFLATHRTFIRLICAMPYVEMVALSGSIAHLNLEADGDLDLCIITKGRRVWSTAVAVVLLAKLLRRRRTVCANFIVADTALGLDQQDFFTASQIMHLKPFRGLGAYSGFVAANPFIRRFYPNFHPHDNAALLIRSRRISRRLKAAVEWLLAWPSAGAEVLCRRAYRSYLRRRAATWTSPEQVRLDDDCVKLHTNSHRHSVTARFDRLLEEYQTAAGLDVALPHPGIAAGHKATAVAHPAAAAANPPNADAHSPNAAGGPATATASRGQLEEECLSAPAPPGSVQRSRPLPRHRFSPARRG